jgi:type III pantothenate kinase
VVLLIDIGNSRIKWATLQQDLGPMHAATFVGWDRAAADAEILSSFAKPERVLISNVAGDVIARILTDACLARWNLHPEIVRVSDGACGVHIGYKDPGQLGVDRWLGVIAAFRRQGGAACVASIGTAMTVDGIDAAGTHLGGVIVPGPDLAKRSLFKNTSDLASRSQSGYTLGSLFADNTLAAIDQGIAHMLAAVIERFCSDMEARLGKRPALMLAGGASDRVASALRVPFQSVPDLVLRGLAAIARS